MFGFDFMNSVFPVIFTVMFVGIFIMFIVTAVRGIGRWHKNNNSPRLTVDATIVSKRMDVTHHHNSTTHTNSSSTWYYATFQVASGDRMELSIPTQDYFADKSVVDVNILLTHTVHDGCFVNDDFLNQRIQKLRCQFGGISVS